MSDEQYNSTLSRNRFLFPETKIVAKLKLDGLNDSIIVKTVKEENLFQYKNQRDIIKSVNTILRRLIVLDHTLLRILAEDNIDRGRMIALFSLWSTDRLFREFLSEVVWEKLYTRQYELQISDMRIFFGSKAEQNSVVAGWTERTFKDMREAYRRILVDVSMLKRETGELRPLLLPKDIMEYLNSINERAFVLAVTGGSK